MRIGHGFDVHAFGGEGPIIIGGVRVPYEKGLLAHSDGDVALHALTDALLGAIADGDIGSHFPPSDPQWKGAESKVFLAHAMRLARAKGFALANCDVTLIRERPKVGPHAEAMRQALAAIMEVAVEKISAPLLIILSVVLVLSRKTCYQESK